MKSKKINKTLDLTKLPRDMILEIIRNLQDYQDIINLGQTAKYFNRIIQDPSYSPIINKKLREILDKMGKLNIEINESFSNTVNFTFIGEVKMIFHIREPCCVSPNDYKKFRDKLLKGEGCCLTFYLRCCYFP